MKTSRTIITIFFTVGLGALASSLVSLAKHGAIDWYLWAFAVFYMLFRLKMFLDDLEHFKSNADSGLGFQIGFVMGMISWFFWLACAMFLKEDFDQITKCLALAILISTLWLLWEAIQQWRGKKIWPDEDVRTHILWICINCLFLAVCVVAIYWKWDRDMLGYAFLFFSFVVLIDGCCSDSLKVLTHAQGTQHSELGWESAKTILTVFFTIGLGALALSLPQDTPVLWSFVGFLGLMRSKMFLDQLKYYHFERSNSTMFKINFIVALISWSLWFVSAVLVRKDSISFGFAVGAIGVSTFWLIPRLWSKSWKLILTWIVFNIANICVLTLALRRRLEGDSLMWIFGLLCAGVLLNGYISKSIQALDE